MEDNLIELLETFGYKVRRQGGFLEDEAYPDTFITFWNASESEAAAYDNETKRVVYMYNVNVYSDDPGVTFSLLRDIRKLLKKNGYIITTRGRDVISDEPSHTGRGLDAVIIADETEE